MVTSRPALPSTCVIIIITIMMYVHLKVDVWLSIESCGGERT